MTSLVFDTPPACWPISAPPIAPHGQLALFYVNDPWEMVADMSDVTFIDLDGVTAIVDARQALRTRSCALTITHPSATVSLMLKLHDLTGLVRR